MTDSIKKPSKYHPSQGAFQRGDQVISPSNSGCQRKILFQSWGLKEEVPAIYQDVGKAFEDYYEQGLKDRGVTDYNREHEIRTDKLSGRIDFLLSKTHIVECKGMISKRGRLEIIRKGKPKTNHLAQVVGYMVHLEQPIASLEYGYMEWDKDHWRFSEGRHFQIKIESDGRITYDTIDSGFTVFEYLEHFNKTLGHLNNQTLGPRPYASNPYNNACSYCPFKSVCSVIDTPDREKSTDHRENARLSLEQYKQIPKKEIEIPIYKPKKKGKKK